MAEDHIIAPQNDENEKTVVIFFHGYGSSGKAMYDHVGPMLQKELPSASLHFPDAPDLIGEDEHGNTYRSWFYIQDILDNPDPDIISERAEQAAQHINRYIDSVIEAEGVAAENVIIAGFSLGATMAYYAALHRDEPVGGVYSLSGGALDRLTEPKSKPPVLLLAGEHETQDYSGTPHALKTHDMLEVSGFMTECVIVEDNGHNISPKCIEFLGMFARYVTSQEFRDKLTNANTAPKTQQRSPKYKP